MSNEPRKVFISRQIPDCAHSYLQAHYEVTQWPHRQPPTSDQLIEACRNQHGLLSCLTERIDAAFLAHCPELKVISNMAVGFDNIDVAAARARGIRIGHTPGVLTEATAELALALLMAVARRLPEGARQVVEGQWGPWDPIGTLGFDLHGKRLGIVGFGRIGQRFASLCHKIWQMPVAYYQRHPVPASESLIPAVFEPDLQKLLAVSDIVSLHANLHKNNVHMCNAEFFSAMPTGSIFLNTARGGLVDQNALLKMLDQDKFFGVGLDVTDPEPLPCDHPLVHHRRCLVLPHMGSATRLTRERMAQMAAENLDLGLRAQKMRAEVLD